MKLLSRLFGKRREEKQDKMLVFYTLMVVVKAMAEQTEILKGILELLQPLRKPPTPGEAAEQLAGAVRVREEEPHG